MYMNLGSRAGRGRRLIGSAAEETVLNFGAACDGSTDDAAAVSAMHAAVGYVVFPPGNTYINTDTTLNNYSAIYVFQPGAYVTVNTGITLELWGLVESPRQHIFRGDGTITFGGFDGSRQAHAAWFGALARPDVDSTAGILKAFAAFGNVREGNLFFSMGRYHLKSASDLPILVPRCVRMIGMGERCTQFMPGDITSSNPLFKTNELGCEFWYFGFENNDEYAHTGPCIEVAHDLATVVGVRGGSLGESCLLISDGSGHKLRDLRMHGTVAGVLVTGGAGSSVFDNVGNIGTGESMEAVIKFAPAAGEAINGCQVRDVRSNVPGVNVVEVEINGSGASVNDLVIDGVSSVGAHAALLKVLVTLGSMNGLKLSNFDSINTSGVDGIVLETAASASAALRNVMMDFIDVGTETGSGLTLTKGAGSTFDKVTVGGGCSFFGAATPFDISGGPTGVNIAPTAMINRPSPVVNLGAYIVDDGFVEIDLFNTLYIGIIEVAVLGHKHGKWTFRATASPALTAVGTPHADFDTATTALNGTTGTDGKITVSATNTGKLYIENRSGVSTHFCIMYAKGPQ